LLLNQPRYYGSNFESLESPNLQLIFDIFMPAMYGGGIKARRVPLWVIIVTNFLNKWASQFPPLVKHSPLNSGKVCKMFPIVPQIYPKVSTLMNIN
jgi:hypothetical protein